MGEGLDAQYGQHGLTKRNRLDLLVAGMEGEVGTFLSHWRDLGDYMAPRRTRFYKEDRNRGDKRSQKIIDSTAVLAARTHRSGMMAGITSPARPWFRLTVQDSDLADFGPAREWLQVVTRAMATVFIRSNLYTALPTVYGDLGVFGTASMGAVEDDDTLIRFYPFPIGNYFLANDGRMRVGTFARRFQLTVRQMVEQFAPPTGKSGTRDWSRLSLATRNLYLQGQHNAWVDVTQIIYPNDEYRADLDAGDGVVPSGKKRWASCHYEPGQDQARFLRESGYDEFPIMAPRWEVTGEDVYGTSCPGMEALGDVKQLQLMERRGAEGLEKMVKPPMTAPVSMMNRKASVLPGDITYVTEQNGQGFKPAYQIEFRLDLLEQKEQQIRQRISRAFFEDLFLMLAQSDRRQITAREVDERHEEKLLMLGPVLERVNDELLDPLIDRTYAIMDRRGLIPPPPDDLIGKPLKVEYVSIMAQAQKMAGLAGLERFSGFMGSTVQLFPEARHKIDILQVVDEYADMTGVPPRIIRSDDAAAALMQRDQQAAQQQQAAAVAAESAQAGKALSETNTTDKNALTDILRLVGSGAAEGL